ncbi:similar to Saccharomyces cerevisiae YMR244C-A Putative protein of unknown function [Maudiozyma barnettii]|uniref:Cytochrome c oxidase assembly factor 6 n=1 Tax=Maudiozyma barnettii TaxID=61262 RepID=A0A8H2ZFS4_9SACH|nr:Coa6p [Kazachstania barnettii]CAB4252655.1 similar to Saccharomyces cerevisiae YMR244C-A Putative protein of unknown function [Kazachstania barnettii]CAD1780127.1 similar to Saccharomyces cerevisiae YMR244C-A Putative protein of unknown function [Kazachstania barnettii]
MVWFPFVSGNKPEFKNNREARKQCWESRDIYFDCLNKIDVISPLDPKNKIKIKKNCSNQEKGFENDCANSWISYFKEKRVTDYRNELIQKQMQQDEQNQNQLQQK